MGELYFGISDNFTIARFKERQAIDEIGMIMSAFDCVVPDESGVYCSSDITSGRRYYEMLQGYGVHSELQLKTVLGNHKYEETLKGLRAANIERGLEFTENVRSRIPGQLLVNPGPFSAPGFKQEHYLYLWEMLIIQKIREVWFNEDWEYSNGCTLEYAIAAKKGVPRLDNEGQALQKSLAALRIGQAIEDLKTRGFSTTKLEHNLGLLHDVG